MQVSKEFPFSVYVETELDENENLWHVVNVYAGGEVEGAYSAIKEALKIPNELEAKHQFYRDGERFELKLVTLGYVQTSEVVTKFSPDGKGGLLETRRRRTFLLRS